MPDMMARGMAWLAAKQQAHCSRRVVYVRATDDGETERIPVRAVLARPGATGEDSVPSLRIDSGDLDFIVPAAQLRRNGEPITPRSDDRIEYDDGGRRYIHEILPRGEAPPWRWCDAQQTLLRIHTRRVDDFALEKPT